jgi:pantetheine-phosphate adenylyltransferase
MTKKSAVYAGSFDPFTNGHMDIVKRALSIFDEVTLLLAVSPSKKSHWGSDKKKVILEEVFKEDDRVKVDTCSGLLVDYAKDKNMDAIVRGLRATGDFDFEFQMASMNRKLRPGIETVFLVTGEQHYYVSSSLVKEVFNHGGDISSFVPEAVYREMMKKRL